MRIYIAISVFSCFGCCDSSEQQNNLANASLKLDCVVVHQKVHTDAFAVFPNKHTDTQSHRHTHTHIHPVKQKVVLR